jgi:hypothetical protein
MANRGWRKFLDHTTTDISIRFPVEDITSVYVTYTRSVRSKDAGRSGPYRRRRILSDGGSSHDSSDGEEKGCERLEELHLFLRKGVFDDKILNTICCLAKVDPLNWAGVSAYCYGRGDLLRYLCSSSCSGYYHDCLILAKDVRPRSHGCRSV